MSNRFCSLSQVSRFDGKNAIRGGVPVILPWFGPREGAGARICAGRWRGN